MTDTPTPQEVQTKGDVNDSYALTQYELDRLHYEEDAYMGEE